MIFFYDRFKAPALFHECSTFDGRSAIFPVPAAIQRPGGCNGQWGDLEHGKNSTKNSVDSAEIQLILQYYV